MPWWLENRVQTMGKGSEWEMARRMALETSHRRSPGRCWSELSQREPRARIRSMLGRLGENNKCRSLLSALAALFLARPATQNPSGALPCFALGHNFQMYCSCELRQQEGRPRSWRPL